MFWEQYDDLLNFSVWLQLVEEQQGGVCGAMHQWSWVLDSGCEKTAERSERVPCEHSMAEELLAAGLNSLAQNPNNRALTLASDVNVITLYHGCSRLQLLCNNVSPNYSIWPQGVTIAAAFAFPSFVLLQNCSICCEFAAKSCCIWYGQPAFAAGFCYKFAIWRMSCISISQPFTDNQTTPLEILLKRKDLLQHKLQASFSHASKHTKKLARSTTV